MFRCEIIDVRYETAARHSNLRTQISDLKQKKQKENPKDEAIDVGLTAQGAGTQLAVFSWQLAVNLETAN